jgi:CxxC-x17-CxxC domain-containing protein
MPQGNWKCSSCGGTITELPFVPRSESGLTCRICYAKKKGGGGSAPAPTFTVGTSDMPPDIPFDAPLSSEPMPGDDLGLGETPTSPEKNRVAGNWTCAECGGAITSLPFVPRTTNNLKCLDCFKRSRS